MKDFAVNIAGVLLFTTAILLVKSSNVLWWPFLMFGTAIVLFQLARLLGVEPIALLFTNGLVRPLLLWLTYVMVGVAVEFVRIQFALWPYADIYENSISIALILLFGYPAMLVICLEVYSIARKRLHATVAFVGTFAFIAALNDIPNAITPMWSVPEHTSTILAVLFPVGYLFEAAAAIAVYHAISRRS